MTNFTRAELDLQAEKLFPLVDYVPKSAVLHARASWVQARVYLYNNKIKIKPVINVKD